MDQAKITRIAIIAAIVLVLTAGLSNSTFLTIESGHKGVQFHRFGGGLDVETVYSQGFHVILPWNEMYVYDVRLQESFEKMNVLSKNGLTIEVELSYRYSPKPGEIGYLHDAIGTQYHDRIVIPEVRSATREVIGKYLPEELYSTKREAIQDEIYTRTNEAISPKHLVLDAVLIREVALPTSIQEAIERKLTQEQESFEYEFRLVKAEQEAERQRIEAAGKAKANEIISASLTDKILRDKGIEATLELATSPNSKVVVVGGEGDGLPLILGQ